MIFGNKNGMSKKINSGEDAFPSKNAKKLNIKISRHS